MTIRAARLGRADAKAAKRLFAMMASVFQETCKELSDAFVERLLSRPEFWAIAAVSEGELVGGITAHTLPMTRSESFEVFLYDLAVREDHQRRGIGRQLVAALRTEAAALGIREVFVAADEGDVHALDFYRALGGAPAPVTMFSFSRPLDDPDSVEVG